MKNYFKYSILISLALMMTISAVFAQSTPSNIGKTGQSVPWDSNPTTHTTTGLAGLTDPTKMYDGLLDQFGSFTGGSGLGSAGNIVFKTFTKPTNPAFTPGWVDIKIKYKFGGTLNDTFWIEYSKDTGATWTILVGPVAGAASAFSVESVRPFTQVAVLGASPAWTDIDKLQVRLRLAKVTTWDAGLSMSVYEVWATVYPLPTPPVSSTTISVQPPEVSGLQYGFIDVYVQQVTDMLTYEYTIDFDPSKINVVTAKWGFSYWPWTSALGGSPLIDNTAGKVYVSYGMPPPVPIGSAFTGNSPVTRIYFQVMSMGVSPLTFRKGAAECILGDSTGTAIARTIYDGVFRTGAFLSAVTDLTSLTPTLLPTPITSPIGTFWHELYPVYSHKYTLTSFTDNGDGKLSASDQIDMLDEAAATRWFHVDMVTTTIHFTFKDPGDNTTPIPGIDAKAEPLTPPTLPMGSPIGTRWHIVWASPDLVGAGVKYCEWFTITSWTDQGTTGFDPSDQFDFSFDNPDLGDIFGTGTVAPYWAHLDAVSTDIIVTEKPVAVPEFPLGLGIVTLIAPMIAIVYIWRLRKNKELKP